MTDTRGPWNQHGGLTLIPLRGYEKSAERLKAAIEAQSQRDDSLSTPVDIARPTFGTYANGEPDIQLDKKHVGGHDCVILTSGPGTIQMISDLMWTLAFVAARRASRVMVVTGYFPLGRSDKDEGHLRLTTPPMLVGMMKAVATLPSGTPVLDRIVCADPHSPQITMAGGSGFVTPIILSRRLLSPIVTEAQALNPRICLAFPDDGAAKRFESAILRISQDLGIEIPMVYGIKRRDIRTGKSQLIAMYGDLEALPGSVVIMLDDEIATGGSVIDMGRMLKDTYRAHTVWAGVTHGVFAGSAVERFMAEDSPVQRLITMDTIGAHNRPELVPMLERGLLQTHSWEPDLARVIYHHHWNENIREVR
ncbi:hypothetical protein CO174_02880 [Candidatus Uhrbacteria bacterium CG_4_9_14_3_um_filter_50_9]|uniref:ribose-phosphate diphosphokinase n=1 Tax=Candidatus Uhrbacteria bacterium CG_4_9_14_3_um_filter_50_9 TaxID=1975035 RepID=A0A2M7XC80_9BACT|nr:MAG: hypothetical protein CO174_02880 [Candidatus Uhrbacteria bacterium CG_4_9_14_3_um_filter_50_9]